MKALRGAPFVFYTGCLSNLSTLKAPGDGCACSVLSEHDYFRKYLCFRRGVAGWALFVVSIPVCFVLRWSVGGPFPAALDSIALLVRLCFVHVFLPLVAWGPNACGVVAACAMRGTSRLRRSWVRTEWTAPNGFSHCVILDGSDPQSVSANCVPS